MSGYQIKVRARAFEYYEIDAESAQEARENWYNGEFLHSEVYESDVEDVELIEE